MDTLRSPDRRPAVIRKLRPEKTSKSVKQRSARNVVRLTATNCALLPRLQPADHGPSLQTFQTTFNSPVESYGSEAPGREQFETSRRQTRKNDTSLFKRFKYQWSSRIHIIKIYTYMVNVHTYIHNICVDMCSIYIKKFRENSLGQWLCSFEALLAQGSTSPCHGSHVVSKM